jgi:hypothetical protein
MSVSRYPSGRRGILLGLVLSLLSTPAIAQKREFSFAYDQPKSSGYGAGQRQGMEQPERRAKELGAGGSGRDQLVA